MSALVTIALAALLAGGRPAPDSTHPPPPPDAWLGSDKVKHFFLAGLTTATAFSAARLAGLDRRPALAVGASAAVLVSVGKEIHDRHVRFSGRDLVADALGALAYGALVARTVR